ncbi:MAG: ubiquinone anaerobic biosynthesis accessory factor UbiT [Steroidobacteraceae bacterium]
MIAFPPRRPPWLADLDPFGQLFVRVFNHLARGQSIGAALAQIEGKRVRICVTDAPVQLHLCVAGGALKVAPAGSEPHVTLRGRLADFARLASRAEDSDTLFFQRRLSLEGETETGLLIKNALDALEWDWRVHLAALVPAAAARLVRAALRPLPPPPRSPFERHRPPR